MWFTQAKIYHYQWDGVADLDQGLMDAALKPCPPHARSAFGWLPVMDDQFVHTVAGCMRVCLGQEERLLPRSVIAAHVNERIKNLEIQRGYPVKRAEKAQMSEEVEFELLPKAFCVQKKTYALLDSVQQLLIINTTSENQATQVIGALRQAIPDLHIEPLTCPENLAQRFAHWMLHPSMLPANMQLASDCRLMALDDENKKLTCKGYDWPAEEILTLLHQGLVVQELSLIWNERIHLTLSHDLTLKRLKCQDYLLDDFAEARQEEGEAQQADASLAILAGELRSLWADLFTGVQTCEPLPVPCEV